MRQTVLTLLLSVFFIGSEGLLANENWNTYEVNISGTTVLVNEYKDSYADKVLLLPGGTGVTDGKPSTLNNIIEGQTGLAQAYAAKGKQLVFLLLPYFEDGRNSIEKAAQEVLNIIDYALDIGYLKPNYTLVGGSAGTLMISAMLDFNQVGEVTNQRLIDNVGRVVMLSGPYNNAQDNSDFQSQEIINLMEANNVTKLTSLDPSLNIHDRWGMYLDKLVNKGGLRIVVGSNDNILCKDDTRCNVSMDLGTNSWIQEVTKDYDGKGLYSIGDLPDIVKVVEGSGHALPFDSFKDYIMN
ncbi:MAG: hypothetical protein KAG61_04470 [Bacteriovoracaceae bacterium]|nr:hypothetical protein [Bacteriovoracaceae bacterium]